MLNKTRHIVFFTGDLCCPVSSHAVNRM